MIECILKGGPLDGQAWKITTELLEHGIVYFNVPNGYPSSLGGDFTKLPYRVKSVGAKSAVLEFEV